jgi:stage II sporulation protein D
VRRTALALALALIACSTRSPRIPMDRPPEPRTDRTPGTAIRIALAATSPLLSATRDFAWYTADGRTLVLRSQRAQVWRLETSAEGNVRAVVPAGTATSWQRQLLLRPLDTGFVTVNGKRFRGDLLVSRGADGLPLVVNRVGLEDYLRGVVAVEMGSRPRSDSAALQAQAIASRSYAILRMTDRPDFDLRATVADQAYGGVDAENANASAAVTATRGLVLRYQGRIVNAMYSSTCGGMTAEPKEIWRSNDVPYLQRVSDQIGGGTTARYYCDAAPRYRWTRTFTAPQLDAALAQYLSTYASVPPAGPGPARHVSVTSTTPSGRVAVLEVETQRGEFSVRGDDIRWVLRSPGGDILNSTYFSVEPEYDRDGVITRVTFRGRGYGHGVGMCQWGAIGRARAGQSYRTILGTYYPGTTIGASNE